MKREPNVEQFRDWNEKVIFPLKVEISTLILKINLLMIWETIQFVTVMYDVTCRFFVGVLYHVEDVPPYSKVAESCCHERVLGFFFFFLSTHIIIWFFFSLALWCDGWATLIGFEMLSQYCTWNKYYLYMVYYSFHALLDLTC